MSERRPFAYGFSGRLLTSTEGTEVFCCDGGDEAPYFIHAMDGVVTGVRNVREGVLACDETGALVLLVVPEGSVAWRVELGVSPTALAATESGYWAAVHDRGVVWGQGPEQRGTIDLPGASGAVFRDEQTLGVVSEGGYLEICALSSGRQTSVEIGAWCNSVTWSALGWWLVASEQGVHRVEADGGVVLRFLKWSGEPLSAVCASKRGGLCAFVTDDKYVVVFGVVSDINCGTIIYIERSAYELEFGPANMLGIGIGMGDGNKIDLTRAGMVSRTDPPADRPRNSWMLQPAYDPAEVERALELERTYRAGQIRFEDAEMIVERSPADERRAAAAEAKSERDANWITAGLVALTVIIALVWHWLE